MVDLRYLVAKSSRHVVDRSELSKEVDLVGVLAYCAGCKGPLGPLSYGFARHVDA